MDGPYGFANALPVLDGLDHFLQILLGVREEHHGLAGVLEEVGAGHADEDHS